LAVTLSATQNNYDPASFVPGTTNRLIFTVPSGGAVITGLISAADGSSIFLYNTSSTDSVQFPHLSGSSSAGNQFSCPQGLTAFLQPLAGVVIRYITGSVNCWTFS